MNILKSVYPNTYAVRTHGSHVLCPYRSHGSVVYLFWVIIDKSPACGYFVIFCAHCQALTSWLSLAPLIFNKFWTNKSKLNLTKQNRTDRHRCTPLLRYFTTPPTNIKNPTATKHWQMHLSNWKMGMETPELGTKKPSSVIVCLFAFCTLSLSLSVCIFHPTPWIFLVFQGDEGNVLTTAALLWDGRKIHGQRFLTEIYN